MADSYVFRIGNFAQDTVTGLHALRWEGYTTGTHYESFLSGTAIYTVPSSKNFYATKLILSAQSTGAYWNFGYATGNASATTTLAGAVTTTTKFNLDFVVAAGPKYKEQDIFFSAPSSMTLWGYIAGGAGGSYHNVDMYGVEL